MGENSAAASGVVPGVGAPQDFDLLIDGEWRATNKRLARHNPARPDEIVGTSARGTLADVHDAYAAAAKAFPIWRATPAQARGRILRAAADLLDKRVEQIATTLALEEGKAIVDARGEVRRAAEIFRFHAGQATEPEGEIFASATAGTQIHVIREPLGVICAITPWNFPIAIPAWKLAPALIYGNTVVWKPAEIAAGTAALLAQALQDAGLPAGVLNLVTGRGSELGDALLAAPQLAGVTFTGSNAVGSRIRNQAAEHGVKAQLELGGKNAAVVLADADLDRAAGCVARAAMVQTGQRCTATSRAIVVRDVLDGFTERLITQCEALKVGDPLSEDTNLGPLASAAQLKTVRRYLQQAESSGLTPVIGGLAQVASADGEARSGDDGPAADGDQPGYFAAPTIYANVDPSDPLAREEIFGPVLAIIVARDAEHAIELANDSEYGLSASLFTSDARKALTLSRALEAGVVHVNGESAGAEPHIAFGGVKSSSSGSREQGAAAREFFTERKTIYFEDL